MVEPFCTIQPDVPVDASPSANPIWGAASSPISEGQDTPATRAKGQYGSAP